MKLAKASQQEIDTLMKWLQDHETEKNPPPPFMRVVFGYETLLQHCADPAADVLEFKPELKAAMEDKARLDWLDAETRGDNGLPVAALVVKCKYERHSSHWANVAGPIRAAIDEARKH